MIHRLIDQNTDEWLDIRRGKATASQFHTIMAHFGKGLGDPALDYALNIALERVTGERSLPSFKGNTDTIRGHEQEPMAVEAYENETFSTVRKGGFFDCGSYGCSPDGLVDGNGAIEIRSCQPHVHYQNMRRGGIIPAKKWQIMGYFLCCGVDWVDCISFSPQFPEGKQLFMHRADKKDYLKEVANLSERLKEFEAEVEKIRKELTL